MRRMVANIFWLGTKELRAFSHDFVLRRLGVWAFSFSIVSIARSSLQELHDASIGIADEDQSLCRDEFPARSCRPTSRRLGRLPRSDIEPPDEHRGAHVRDRHPTQLPARPGGRPPAPATGLCRCDRNDAGRDRRRLYRSRSSLPNSTNFLSRSEVVPRPPVNLDVRIAFNPNVTTAWFTSVMAIINNVTMLAIILAGAAIVREREHGTMDHLLVMPLTPFEIAMSKIWSNALVITVAVGLSPDCRRARAARRSHCRVRSFCSSPAS